MRQLSTLDQLLDKLRLGAQTISSQLPSSRPNPADRVLADPTEPGLTAAEQRLSGALMRVNHVGEVCAQALYEAQALLATDSETRAFLKRAAQEEADHLAWTAQRLNQLKARPSVLNPLWYAGAFGLGLVAARFGPEINLGFVRETERQVEQHLAEHLERLPANDYRSRAIVEQMKADEACHGEQAKVQGGGELPAPIVSAMRACAKLMTTTAHYI